jgi:HAD superfamily hydrolase (TIGR01509 family)
MTPDLTLPAAAIFDMDGVLIDSNPFHLRKWVALLKEHRIPFDEEELPKVILGHRNDSAFRHYFGEQLTREQMHELSEELEAKFRQAFAPHARPLPGLRRLMEECHASGIAMAVASSAVSKNVEFIVEALELRPYLRVILTGDEVSHPKPDPEIYLKTAAKLGVQPAACVAFEDSFVGVEAAKRAGMKCLGIASTFPAEDLRRETHADLVVPSFEVVSLQTLRQLFDSTAAGNRH